MLIVRWLALFLLLASAVCFGFMWAPGKRSTNGWGW